MKYSNALEQSYSRQLTDNFSRLDIYFRGRDGSYYVWTPTWNKGTRQLFSHAYLISGDEEAVLSKLYEKTESTLADDEEISEHTDFQLLATQLGNALGSKVSYQKVDKAARAFFEFDSKIHQDSGMVYITSQNIYDWVMTLGEQPIGKDKKMILLKK